MPERTFEWNRYVYVVVHGKELPGRKGIERFPNILEGEYLDEISRLEVSLPANVTFEMEDQWRANETLHIQDEVTFQVQIRGRENYNKKKIIAKL